METPKGVTQAGFSLIEVMVAVVLLVVGAVALIQILGVVMFADNDVENTTQALYLAQEKIEEIRNASSYGAIDGFFSARTNLGGDFADFDRSVAVSGDPKQVTVAVFWKSRGVDQNITLTSLFANYGY